MKQTIYIAGKVTGLKPEAVAVKFAAAQELWENKGFEVVNPITLIDNIHEPWETAMKKCLDALTKCDAIYMLPCAGDSPGAQIELDYAMHLGIDLYAEI